MSWFGKDEQAWFVGKAVERVVLNTEKDAVDFYFVGGLTKRLGVEGDCCSHSWVEHLTLPDNLAGAVIHSVDEPPLLPHDGHTCDEEVDSSRKCGHDCLAVYHTRFRTDRGDIVLEYRNDSNGYYGGNLTDEGPIP